MLFLLAGLSLLLLFYTPVPKANHTKFRLFIFSLWLMMAAWFFTAPDPRFAFGFLLFLSLFPVSIFLSKYISFSKIAAPALAILSLAVLIYTVKKSDPLIKHPGYLAHVVNTDSPPFKNINANNAIFHVPEKINDSWNNRCFFIPLPCLCEENPFLQLRGSHIRKGFLMNPVPDSIFIRNYNY